MGEIKSYKDLLIWQKGIKIVCLVYQLVKSFPQEELYALTSQIKRASISIPSNIAEGAGRNSNAQFKNFLQISIGSCFEVETQLIISKELEYISEEELETISKELDSIMKMNHNLQKTL